MKTQSTTIANKVEEQPNLIKRASDKIYETIEKSPILTKAYVQITEYAHTIGSYFI